MTSTPRIRVDLQATPAEEGGIKYFDVADPKSGSRMRLYDFEWLIAERMDGRRPFDEVASWARERLGIEPSPSDLEEYARKLEELGFLDLEASAMASTGNGAGARAVHDDHNDDMPPLVAEHPLIGSSRDTVPAATAPTMAMPVTTERPAVTPPPPAERPAPARTPAPAAHSTTGRTAAVGGQPSSSGSSAGSIIGIVLVLAVVAGIVAYVKLMGGDTAKVTTVVAAPREVVRLFDGAATVKKSDGQTLAFGEAGKVSDVVAAGTEAKAGMPLATLDSYGKIEKELADVKDRAGYYEKQLAADKAKGDEEAAKNAQAKVAEKQKLLGELEARAARVRLVAPGPATVAQALVTAGADVAAGAPVVRLADKRNLADFKLPAAAAAVMKPGDAVTLQPAAGGATFAGRVAKVVADVVTVELADNASAKPGDSVRLVKARVANVVPVPTAALVQRDGRDAVFVLSDGAVHQRKVTVVDKTPTEVLIGTGLTGGDQIVSSGADGLKDGEKAAP